MEKNEDFKEANVFVNEPEVQKENNFLHLRLGQLSNEVVRLTGVRETEHENQKKFQYYEAMIEDLMA